MPLAQADIDKLNALYGILVADVQKLGAAVSALVAGTVDPPVVIPPVASGAIVVAPAKDVVTDANGATFAWGAPMSDIGATVWGYKLMLNGAATNPVGVILTTVGGVCFMMNCLGQWYSYRNGKWQTEQPSPLPVITSKDGTVLTDVGGFMFDAKGDCFFIWSHLDPTYGASVAVNGDEKGNIGTQKLSIAAGVVASTDAKGNVRRWVNGAWA